MSALSLVATPIGNLSDVSDRARAVLAAADVIYAEDTRHSGRLLKHLGVDARLRSCHDHNERQRAVEIVDDLRAGRSVALVSDAGTPGIADPGHVVARSVIDAGFDVTMIPGPSAVVMAVVLSGFATDRFVFDGWLPRRSGGLRRRIEELAAEPRTVVVLESNHRLPKSLPVFAEVVGDRRLAVCRELTKRHEEVRRGTAHELLERYGTRVKGEIVLVMEGAAA
ncbi:MAG TPA: 16S rRNA (cytidine(1402)-2'-O)-methyltransferase [Candidatus Krumholzibacteria bacterium]|nr:16S rRNA (cytidine(1402)-2'-O)-methyltransferase [Candidatus Krumholzibacteria bacterium]